MPSHVIKDRLVPYKILSYLLYSPLSRSEWLERVSENEVRVFTGEASRALRMKNTNLWDSLYWLEEQSLVISVKKEKKRGTAIIRLKQPVNIKVGLNNSRGFNNG